MTFEEWWDSRDGWRQLDGASAIAIRAYAAGRESMRDECVRVCERLSERWPDEGGDARGCLHEIKELK